MVEEEEKEEAPSVGNISAEEVLVPLSYRYIASVFSRIVFTRWTRISAIERFFSVAVRYVPESSLFAERCACRIEEIASVKAIRPR